MDGRDREWVRQRSMNVIGHALRTPATTVRGLVETLAASPDHPERAELMQALVSSSARLESLLDDLLTAVGVTTALPVGPPHEVDLAERVAAVRPEALHGPQIRGTASVLARPESVDRILAEVLDNAAAYGDGPVSVRLAVRPARGRATLTVDSPGPELPPEDLRFAVRPFWRGERAVMTRPGLGLGLAVARELARHEGGTLRVRGRRGGGLLTVVELPVRSDGSQPGS